ncbi:DUF3422 family protein [Noviherbaspirillum suwonense]|jgi:uncharacterized membrane-anchored protein|uniref:Uncharacterized membrane-anchored protein n=1 Tax=Noviherbaspirillum suwonense TaxID=1224511 RepID=A0ABY1PT46_9BURK|nr:DUF3422 domain-containing protein [Noviherbaspirillum suwonense]SMP45657.1 Uncharacterized membrane-anchored protein [Noviherbaspirillum suwonense]
MIFSSLNHPLRVPLAAEVHSRPFLHLHGPEAITHLAVYAGNGTPAGGINSGIQHAILAELCGHFGVTAPAAEGKFFFHDFGRFRLKWECHTEFATYTFSQRQDTAPEIEHAFERMPLQQVPQQWLAGLDGKIMVATHVVLDGSDTPVQDYGRRLRRVFEGNTLVASRVLHDAELWTDFLIQADGFSRLVVRDVGLMEQQAGRLVQRVLEIETYRMMCLLGLPHAQQATPVLNAIEGELAALTAAMVATDDSHGENNPDDEQALLGQITRLAARLEKLAVDDSYRFSASQAYFRLVRSRIDELREERMEGFPTVGEFMERRLTPAVNTCAAIASRQEALARRIAQTNDLLRTRVGIVQEQQNRQILQSMNRRAAQQLKLQQAVEGLSVVAISYYMVGLLGYAGKAAKAAGLPLNPDIATGLLVPLVLGAVWLGLRRMHRRMHKG